MPSSPPDAPAARTGPILGYFGVLTVLVYLGSPANFLFDVPSTYILKNQLHATATQVSLFRLLSGTPIYLAFVFGLARDLWSPFGLRRPRWKRRCSPR